MPYESERFGSKVTLLCVSGKSSPITANVIVRLNLFLKASWCFLPQGTWPLRAVAKGAEERTTWYAYPLTKSLECSVS